MSVSSRSFRLDWSVDLQLNVLLLDLNVPLLDLLHLLQDLIRPAHSTPAQVEVLLREVVVEVLLQLVVIHDALHAVEEVVQFVRNGLRPLAQLRELFDRVHLLEQFPRDGAHVLANYLCLIPKHLHTV